jgi:hypothetical protein
MVPQSNYEGNMYLGRWVHTQRTCHFNDIMRPDRKRLLDEIGFAWKEKGKKIWHQQYEKLVEFKRKNGHCMMPQRSYEQQKKSLGRWVDNQRSEHKNNKIRLDRKGLLDEIGFAWKFEGPQHRQQKLWHQQHVQLVEFKRKNGHCIVPKRYKQDKSLGMWVSTQRSHHNNNKLRPDQRNFWTKSGLLGTFVPVQSALLRAPQM